MEIVGSKDAYSNYGYETVNDSYCFGMYKYNQKKQGYEFIKYGRYIGIERLCKDLDGGETVLTIGFDDVYGDHDTVDIDRTVLGTKKELQTLLLGKGADVHDDSIKVLRKCLRCSEETAEQGLCFHQTGWVREEAEPGSDAEDAIFFKGRYLIGPGYKNGEVRYVGNYDLDCKGSFKVWCQMVKDHVLGWVPMELALLIGLTPIISSLWGSRNLVWHFVGDSGKGKTTAAVLCLSVVGNPNPAETAGKLNVKGKPLRSLMSSWRGTGNALTEKLKGLDGTIMVFDELSKLDDAAVLKSTIYTLSDGSDKDRMASASEMQATTNIRTNILSLGEESLLQKADAKNSGLNVRVCEISTDFTKGPVHSENIVSCCYENYGFAGAEFTKYITQNMSFDEVARLREQNLDEYEAALVAAGTQSTTPRRLAEFGAILLTVADIAEKALKLKFSRKALMDFLVDQQVNTVQNLDIGLRAHAALKSFIGVNAAHFISDGSKEWKSNLSFYGRIETMPDGNREVSVEIETFRTIMKNLNFNNPDIIIQKLKDHGLLNHESGKNYRKRTLLSAVGQVHTYVIVFP